MSLLPYSQSIGDITICVQLFNLHCCELCIMLVFGGGEVNEPVPSVHIGPTKIDDLLVLSPVSQLWRHSHLLFTSSPPCSSDPNPSPQVDMTNLIDLRNKYKDDFEKVHGVKMGFMSAFVKVSSPAVLLLVVVEGSRLCRCVRWTSGLWMHLPFEFDPTTLPAIPCYLVGIEERCWCFASMRERHRTALVRL